MDHWIKFITDNWAIIAPAALLILSEVLALNPKAKSNSVIQLALNLLSRKGR
jgi:hypothetical protein